MQLRGVKDLPEVSNLDAFQRTNIATSEERVETPMPGNTEEPGARDSTNIIGDKICISGKITSGTSEAICSSEVAAVTSNTSVPEIDDQSMGKHEVMNLADTAQNASLVSDDFQGPNKKQKKLSDLDVVSATSEATAALDHPSSDNSENQTTRKHCPKEPGEYTLDEFVSSVSASFDRSEDNVRDEIKDTREVPELKHSSNSIGRSTEELGRAEWKPIEKELYLKGVEMFGRNRYGAFFHNMLVYEL